MSTTMLPSSVATVSSPNRSLSSSQLKFQDSPDSVAGKPTDDTLSTINCDDSLTASSSTNMTGMRLYGPPVAAVSVDNRNVRQRLRDQEAKINALLNRPGTPAAPEAALVQLVATLEADLKKNQDEKLELKNALDALQRQQVVKDDEEKVDVVVPTETPENQAVLAERISRLEGELRRKTHESSLLLHRWETTVRRMVQYQVDLETHDLHFTDYSKEQAAAAKETLAELNGLTAKDQSTATRELGKKTKRIMSTLLKDLECLGDRYVSSKVHQEQQIADLKVAQLEWQRRAEYLEAKCKEHNLDVEEEDVAMGATSMSGPLMKFHQKLRVQQMAALQAQEELNLQVRGCTQEKEQIQLERDVLQREVQRLQQTVYQLQSVVQKQQEALRTAEEAAAATTPASAPKRWKGWFRKTKKTPPPPPPPSLFPKVNVAAALEPMQLESKRFDMLHERMLQATTLKTLQEEHRRATRQRSQLQQTVTDLRVEVEQNKATIENKTLQTMQLEIEELEARRQQEQKEAQATIEELRAQLATLEAKYSESLDV